MKGFNKNLNRAQLIALSLAACAGSGVFAQNAPNYRLPSDGSTTGTVAPNPRAVSLYNLGLTAYKQNSPESAIIFFKRACDIDPNLADAQYNLGVIYQLQKRYREAGPRFEEVLRIKPTDPDAHFQLGIIMQETGRPAEARQHLSAIAPNNPHFQDAQRRLAQLTNPEAVQQTANNQAEGLRDLSGGGNGYSGGGLYGQQPTTAPLAQTPTYQQPATQAYSQPPQTVVQQPSYTAPQNNYSSPGYANQPSQPASTFTPVQQPAQPAQQVAAIQQPGTSYGAPGQQPATTYSAGGQQPAAVAQPVAQTPASKGPVPNVANATLRIIATDLSAPSGLTFDRSGNLYVANYMSNSIDRIGPDGTRSTFCTGASIRGPIGLVSDDSGNIFVANYNGGTVVKLSPAGISSVIASGFKKPYYLTLDRDGNLYVTQQEDNSIVRITLPRTVGSKPTTP